MDDGAGGSYSEVNQASDPLVRNNPGLHELTITSGTSSVGASYQVYVTAFNSDG
jgi:hypothetical protein